MAKTGKKPKPMPDHLRLIPPHAAGIAVGAEEPWSGGPAARAAPPGQTCSAFPCDVQRRADWGTAGRIPTVAMAATGVYWSPLCQLLAARGVAGALVNARQGKHVPGRPHTERFDCRWLQTGPTSAFWAPAFRPPAALCRRRQRREPLIRMTGQHSQQMQKALDPMHLHRPPGLRDLIGVPGLRMLRAIGAGERDPQPCAASRDSRITSRAATLAKALAGAYRPAQLCPLTPSLARAACTPQPRAACAPALARVLRPCNARVDPDEPPFPSPPTTQRPPHRPAPAFALRPPLARSTGVDRTPVPGCQAPTLHSILAEGGLNRQQWPTDTQCASCRGLGPAHQRRGGTVRSPGSRRGQNRARRALRLAAPRLRPRPSSLGAL